METNYQNVMQLWKMVDSMFFASTDYLDKLDCKAPEMQRFRDKYYDFMGEVNKLHDFAKKLPY